MDTLALKHATLKRFWLILIAALWFSNQPFIIQNQLILIFIWFGSNSVQIPENAGWYRQVSHQMFQKEEQITYLFGFLGVQLE